MSSVIELENISQDNYEPTPYVDASWEIVGEPVETKEFSPMEIAVLPQTARYADPMFADYGGIPKESSNLRWHLPEELSAEETQKRLQAERGPVIPTVTLTEEELEQIKQEVFLDGKLAGMEEAVSANTEKMAAIEQKLLELFNDLSKQIAENNLNTEKNAVHLALQIAHKMVGQAVEINPEYIVPIIKEALNLAGSAEIQKVRVSTQDLEFIQLLGIAKTLKDKDKAWEFVADDSIKAGCIIDTSAGEIDYQLDQAWERIKEQVLRVAK
jgi:flagellar assembly protein FliH